MVTKTEKAGRVRPRRWNQLPLEIPGASALVPMAVVKSYHLDWLFGRVRFELTERDRAQHLSAGVMHLGWERGSERRALAKDRPSYTLGRRRHRGLGCSDATQGGREELGGCPGRVVRAGLACPSDAATNPRHG
jgi:hypothetical protein